MRAYIKKEIVQSIGILKNACRKMKLMQCGDGDELLAQCQQLALAIGNQIEQSEQSDFVTVQYLEEFCELLYKLYICKNKSEYNQIIKEIGASLKKIERSVQEDIKNSPYEIVFMPYKASMWDALDSIYRAALKDEACHVTMMPVPYYNRNQKDGQVEVHYEGDQFPADIPVTDFRTYSLEAVHPDAIFIHNPYDQYNYVTQLPPEYFSTNLVHYTDHLVYIPYFITKGDSVKDQYCMMPAVQNAWRTFVQSEAVRKCYVKCGADPNRVIAAGSPKFDMVIQMQKNPPEIPTKWKPALEGRKVFLLNTHLNPIINKIENITNKLRQIFKLFKKQNEAALLWRPHPLSIETLKAMNPGMLEKYLEIVDEFKTLENGVYDDSTNVHRAIALSDAYIGDWSSLVTMYGVTGKPIYLFHMEKDNVFADKDEKAYRFACGVFADEILWVPLENKNALCKVNLETGTAEYVCSFNDEYAFAKELYHKIEFYQDRLFLIPWRAKKIAVYHIGSGKIEYIVQDPDAVYGVPKFSESVRYGQYLYLFSAHAPAIVCLDMEKQVVDCYPECIDDFKQFTQANFGYFFGKTRKEEVAWIPSRRINCLLEYNMENNSYVKHFIGESKAGFIDVEATREQIYVLTAENRVIAWDYKNNCVETIWQSYKQVETVLFVRMLCIEETLWLLPVDGEEIIKIKISENYAVEEIQLPLKNKAIDPAKPMIADYIIQDNKILICPVNSDTALIIDCMTNALKEVVLDKGSFYSELIKYFLQTSTASNPNYLNYERDISLEAFLNFIRDQDHNQQKERGDSFKNLQRNVDGSCGQKIWQRVRKEFFV